MTIGLMLSLTPGRAWAGAFEQEKDNSKDGWIELVGTSGLDVWKATTGWQAVGNVALDPENPKKLAGAAGTGVIFNGPLGRAPNLVTKQSFGDVEVHLEFNVPKGSNSGIKLEAVYEIQIFDSFGVEKMTASHNGGVYPRAELLPRYHYLDEGFPPKTNASRPPGEWQTLDIVWHTPRFDAEGNKTANARFVKVVLNGQTVHENLEVPTPTGNNWRNKETATGPILLQGDHGPVAFRNMRVRPLP
jgi:hypothetical protein